MSADVKPVPMTLPEKVFFTACAVAALGVAFAFAGFLLNLAASSVYDTWWKPQACKAADEYLRGWK